MRRTLGTTLTALGLAALLCGPYGCGGQGNISAEKRASDASLEDELGGADPLAGEALEPVGELGELDLPETETPPAPVEAKKASSIAKPAKKAAASRRAATALPSRAATALPSRAATAPRVGADASDSVLEEIEQDVSFRQEEARYYKRLGDDYFKQNRYTEAEEAYQRAVDLDPLLDEARQRLADAGLMLGNREREIPAVSEDVRIREQVTREQTTAVVEGNLKSAEERLAAGNPAEAERFASRAVDYINVVSEFDPARRQYARNLLEQIRLEKRRLESERQARLLEEAKGKADADVVEQDRLRYQQVQELLRKSMDLMRLHDYDKAIEVCTRVLELDSENRVAKFWISDAHDQLVKQRRYKLITDRLENQKLSDETFAEATIPYNEIFVFPEGDAWEQVRARSEQVNAISTEDPEPIRRIKNALEGTRVNFVFENTALEDVVQQLRTFTGARMLVDPAIDAQTLKVTMNLQGLTASSALNLILDNVGLAYTFRENVLFITNPGQQGGRAEFNMYNVSDLLNKIRDFEGPELMLKPQGDQGGQPITFTGGFSDEQSQLDEDQLMNLIKSSTGGEEAWQDPNNIEYHQGQLLVNATRELHAQMQVVLSNLRKDSDLFVVIEARFIDVNDDFLEDIGIDSRALGAVNNLGTPFGNVINDNRTGGQDLGFTEKGNPLTDVTLVMGQDRIAGRVRQIVDGFSGTIRGDRLSGGNGVGGLTLQSTFLEPFQLNVILRAVQERSDVRQLTAPVVTAHNGQRVYVSVITQRAYIADYNLVSGGTGFAIIEVADPEVQTFQEGVILDVDPVISHDKKYVTLDVKPTLATLIGGVISTILISLGSFTNVAFQVPIGVPQISLQQTFTSVTVPNGGTVLLGGFKSLNEGKFISYLPILGQIPLLNNLFRRKATISEKRSLVILISARIVDLRGEEARKFNPQ